MDYKKSDATLKLQLLRMQLELFCFCKIKLKDADSSLIDAMERYWLSQCDQENVIPENNFIREYQSFQSETLLKFAPETTLQNMLEKAKITIQKMGFKLPA